MDIKTSRVLICFVLMEISAFGFAKESAIPTSAFRRYFWGAREAYDNRDFAKAAKLLRQYRELGSPSDKLLKTAGCDTKWEVDVFTAALKDARACVSHRSQNQFWPDAEHAKVAIMIALRAGDAASLVPYVDCAPADLIQQSTTCGARLYRKPADVERLAAELQKRSGVLVLATWRKFPGLPHEPDSIRWILYPTSSQWRPCEMDGAPAISLRVDKNGETRIAGFAASCFEAENQ